MLCIMDLNKICISVKNEGLPDIVKNFYDEDPSIASMSEEEVFQFR